MSKTITTERRVTSNAAKALVGRTITSVGYLPVREAADLYWSHRPIVIRFDDGSVLYATSDEEGNAPGVLNLERGRRSLCLGRLPATGR